MKRRWVDDCGLRGVALCPANLKKKIMIDVPVRDIRDNLVFSTDFRNFVGNDIKDQSGNIADVTNSGAVRKTGYGCGKSLSFDGSDDYCKQKVYDTQQGTVRIATVNGGAVLWDTGQDFTEFAGAAGSSKGYIAVVSDAEGEVAGGYIGEEGGGETLGSEIILNGNMETGDPPNNWTAEAGSPVLSQVADERTGGGGTYSINCERGSQPYMARQEFSTTIGKTYKVVGWIKNIDAQYGALKIWDKTASVLIKSGTNISATSWTEDTFYFTAIGTTSIIFFYCHNTAGTNVRFDDISIKEVTNFPANESVKIYSTKTGSTQNLAWNEASFDPNDTLTYEVRKSDFQITDALTLGVLFRPDAVNVSDEDTLIGKREAGEAVDGACLYMYEDDIYFRIDDADVAKALAVLRASNWHFAVGIFDGTNVTVHVDGAIGGTVDTGSLADVHYSFQLGYDGTKYFDGFQGYAFVLSKALSVPEQWQLYFHLLRKLGVAQ